ncbi:MAG: S-adenosyl-l-methionine hydroxide adenosyltransferase family protein [Leptospirillia bacterium]
MTESSPPIITLTTDFGHLDPYAGIMRGVILGICPTARIVDLSHGVDPFDTEQAAFVVSQAVPHFPPGSIHMVVVDPGVGGPRHALIAKGRRACYVAPDNNVLGPLLAADGPATVHAIAAPDFLPRDRSTTFHGRDLFAPVAAHLAMGRPLAEFGPRVQEDLAAPFEAPRETEDGWRGKVLHADHFGNLITNLPNTLYDAIATLRVNGATVRPAHHYASVPPGQAGFVKGSVERIELFIREGSARTVLCAGPGDAVVAERA